MKPKEAKQWKTVISSCLYTFFWQNTPRVCRGDLASIPPNESSGNQLLATFVPDLQRFSSIFEDFRRFPTISDSYQSFPTVFRVAPRLLDGLRRFPDCVPYAACISRGSSMVSTGSQTVSPTLHTCQEKSDHSVARKN